MENWTGISHEFRQFFSRGFYSCEFHDFFLLWKLKTICFSSPEAEWLPLAKGTPQGSKLGPALCNLFINDLLYSLPQDSVVNFADDNTLYAVEETPWGLETLNSIVNSGTTLVH